MLTKLDPIIAVKDVEKSTQWYQKLLGCNRIHGESDEFAVLTSENDDVILCLHAWGEHEHPTMMDPSVLPGNGLILYFRTDQLTRIRQNATEIGATVEDEIHQNPNSMKNEFSVRDPDGYYLIISEYHRYGD